MFDEGLCFDSYSAVVRIVYSVGPRPLQSDCFSVIQDIRLLGSLSGSV